jgi:hypothetical protein
MGRNAWIGVLPLILAIVLWRYWVWKNRPWWYLASFSVDRRDLLGEIGPEDAHWYGSFASEASAAENIDHQSSARVTIWTPPVQSSKRPSPPVVLPENPYRTY